MHKTSLGIDGIKVLQSHAKTEICALANEFIEKYFSYEVRYLFALALQAPRTWHFTMSIIEEYGNWGKIMTWITALSLLLLFQNIFVDKCFQRSIHKLFFNFFSATFGRDIFLWVFETYLQWYINLW